MSSEKSLKLVEEYLADDVAEILEDYFEHICAVCNDDEELRDALSSLFDRAYLIGFKTALVERVEEDLNTLDFIEGRIF